MHKHTFFEKTDKDTYRILKNMTGFIRPDTRRTREHEKCQRIMCGGRDAKFSCVSGAIVFTPLFVGFIVSEFLSLCQIHKSAAQQTIF
jgi:hypothetical protein